MQRSRIYTTLLRDINVFYVKGILTTLTKNDIPFSGKDRSEFGYGEEYLEGVCFFQPWKRGRRISGVILRHPWQVRNSLFSLANSSISANWLFSAHRGLFLHPLDFSSCHILFLGSGYFTPYQVHCYQLLQSR